MMYRINDEVKSPDEIMYYLSILTSGVTITDVPLKLGDRNTAVFSGTSLLHDFLQFHGTAELDMHHVQKTLAYDLIQLDMTEQRCFSERSLLWIQRIVSILSKRRPVLILVRNTEDLNRNYELMLTGLKYDSITIDDTK